MEKIFIYYSLSGNGDMVADYLKENKITINKVIPVKELPYGMVPKILTGGFLAGIGYRAKLTNFDADINTYDEIIIGSPIWNGRLSCPINTVLDRLEIHDKPLTFILYSGSGKAPKVDKLLRSKYDKIKIIHLREPKHNQESLKEQLKDI